MLTDKKLSKDFLHITLIVIALLSIQLYGACASVPRITYMRTCSSVQERPSQFEASGWSMQFTAGDSVYCVIKADIPHDAAKRSYSATLRWYAPDGDLYYEHDYKDLDRGYIWSLWGSINSVDIPGQWRVTFSLRYAASRSVSFTVNAGPAPVQPAEPESIRPVIGREMEPNDDVSNANVLTLAKRVQGEGRYYTDTICDDDWFTFTLPAVGKYWLEISAVAETSAWLSPRDFVSVYHTDSTIAMDFSSYSRQERDEERSSCDAVIPLIGPGNYFVHISSCSCHYDLVYSLLLTTTIPSWAQGEI